LEWIGALNQDEFLTPRDLLARDVVEKFWPRQDSLSAKFHPQEFVFRQLAIAEADTPPWFSLLHTGDLSDADRASYGTIFHITDDPLVLDHYWSVQDSLGFNSSLINLTSYALTGLTSLGEFPTLRPEVVIIDSLRAGCLYWNLRALREAQALGIASRRSVFATSLAALRRPDTLATLIDLVKQNTTLDWPFTPPIDLTLISLGENAASAAQEALMYLPEAEVTPSGIFAFQWLPTTVPRSLPPYRVATLTLPQDEMLLVGKLPQSVSLAMEAPFAHRVELRTGANAITFSPPGQFHNPRRAKLLCDLDSPVWARFPRSNSVAHLFGGQTKYRGFGVTQLDSHPDRLADVRFKLPSEWDALTAYFTDRGYSIRESTSGHTGAAILDLLGGIARLGSLVSPLAYKLFQQIAFLSTKKVAQRLHQSLDLPADYQDRILNILEGVVSQEDLVGKPKTLQDLAGPLEQRRALLELLEELSISGILLRGYYQKCPHCTVLDWYPLASVSERLTCRGCGQPFHFPLMSGNGELPWHYRLNGLVNRAVDQDVVPHLLTLYHWTRLNHQPSCITTGLELLKQKEVTAEFDLLFVSHGQLYASECKAGGLLSANDFQAARLAADLGVIAFAFATASRWSQESAHGIAALREELAGRMNILDWDGSELFDSQSAPHQES
jgi:hypothetical protein